MIHKIDAYNINCWENIFINLNKIINHISDANCRNNIGIITNNAHRIIQPIRDITLDPLR